MKWSVYILLMAALIYVGETIRLPFQLAAQQEQQAKDKCCRQGKNCNTTANCSNCTLCYTAELAAAYSSAGIATLITTKYPEIQEQHLTEYTASTWKPPNA